MPFSAADLFPDEDYRFHLTLRRLEPAEFFAAADPGAVAERRQWLAADPARHLACSALAGPLVSDFRELAPLWVPGLKPLPLERTADGETLLQLAWQIEPDFLLLARGPGDAFTLQAGAVCFPSSWSLEEKVGLGLESIHTPVPGLNPKLGGAISQFLARLRPGLGYGRANWGLAATGERNLHPALARPRLTAASTADRIWLRVEQQLLAALPASGGIFFGIRMRILPLAQLLGDPAARPGFLRALRTMPDEVAAYKGLTAIRAALAA